MSQNRLPAITLWSTNSLHMKRSLFLFLLFTFPFFSTAQRTSYLLIEFWDNGAWENGFNRQYQCDAQGFLTQELSETWNSNNQWQNFYIYNYTNNTLGDPTEYLYDIWDDVANSWEKDGKGVYTYNSNDRISSLTRQFWNGSNYENSLRTSYTYDANGFLIEFLEENHPAGWTNSFRFIHNNNAQGNPITSTGQVWFSSWSDSFRRNYTYNANQQVLTMRYETFNGSAWEDNFKGDYIYDGNGYLTNYLESTWNGSNWDQSYKVDYSNNPDGTVQQSTAQIFDNGAWRNVQRQTFQYLPNGLESQQDLKILAFPNPVTDEIHLRSDKFLEGEILIYDLKGKVVYHSRLNPADPALEVSSLSSGKYILKLEGSQGSSVIPFQKN